MAKRMRAKLREVKAELLTRRESVSELGRWLWSVVQGYFNYHAIPGGFRAPEAFHRENVQHWLFALRRRMSWHGFRRLIDLRIPKPQTCTPSPTSFYAMHPRQEPCALAAQIRIRAGGVK